RGFRTGSMVAIAFPALTILMDTAIAELQRAFLDDGPATSVISSSDRQESERHCCVERSWRVLEPGRRWVIRSRGPVQRTLRQGGARPVPVGVKNVDSLMPPRPRTRGSVLQARPADESRQTGWAIAWRLSPG